MCHIVHVPSGEIRKGSFLVNKKSLPSEDEVMKCVSFLQVKVEVDRSKLTDSRVLKKITLLRVIPTMTCWVEVVR